MGIEKQKEENNLKINLLANIHFKELEEVRTENVKLKRDIIDNLKQYETSLKLKDSEKKPAMKNIQVTKSVS